MEVRSSFENPFPQSAPGATAAKGHILDNGIPLSIFPISRSMNSRTVYYPLTFYYKATSYVYACAAFLQEGKPILLKELRDIWSFFTVFQYRHLTLLNIDEKWGSREFRIYFKPLTKKSDSDATTLP